MNAVRLRGADGVDIWAKRFDATDGGNGLLSSAVHAGDVYAVGRLSGTLEGQASAGDKGTRRKEQHKAAKYIKISSNGSLCFLNLNILRALYRVSHD